MRHAGHRLWLRVPVARGAAAAGPHGACRVPDNHDGFDRGTGARYWGPSYPRTLPAEFDVRMTNWSSGSAVLLQAGIVGDWDWLCAL